MWGNVWKQGFKGDHYYKLWKLNIKLVTTFQGSTVVWAKYITSPAKNSVLIMRSWKLMLLYEKHWNAEQCPDYVKAYPFPVSTGSDLTVDLATQALRH